VRYDGLLRVSPVCKVSSRCGCEALEVDWIALFAFVHRPSFKIIPGKHAGILGETQLDVIVDSNVLHLLFVRPRHSSSDEC
jgi:hypothetical protein